MLSDRMEYVSSSVKRSSAMCCAQSGVSVRSKLPPRARPTTSVTAVGNRNCGVTLGGAFGFLLIPVRPLLSHPLASSAMARAEVTPIVVESLICSSHSVRIGWRSRRDVDGKAEALRGWDTDELDSLNVAVVERSLWIDVRSRGVEPQIPSNERHVHRRDAEPAGHRLRHLVVESHFTQLGEGCTHYVGFVVLEQGVEIRL